MTTADSLPPQILKSNITLCQLYEIGDAIDLIQASHCITKPIERKEMSVHVRQVDSIQIAQPPLQIILGEKELTLAGLCLRGILRASVYDLGAIALTLTLGLPEKINWPTVAQLMASVQDLPQELQGDFLASLDELEILLKPAIYKPDRPAITEDYTILVVQELAGAIDEGDLAKNPLIWAALLGEKNSLSPYASQLVTPMSYYKDDLALFSWNGAILIEPDPLAAATAIALIEFANVELLLMRSYDQSLDAQLPKMYRQLPREQSRFSLPLVSRHSRSLHETQYLIAEFTEFSERVDNALKVIDDVYWNRFYTAILNVLRVNVWRAGVEHKLTLLRETYSMLHNEADAERANSLEWMIIILILTEIILALFRY
ncbi:MAG: hypothetical protein N5P05_001317 [Chroococcopsis gigantea SAG 12.99]|jgi:hypothetical protein|nr:hypothetical protein [Chlorogloea purpurea SAG 13.99]MDV2999711.1 hypothetical protein [Chroococcopsis gigantea SAG 12.99]